MDQSQSIQNELFQVCFCLLGTWYSPASCFTSPTSPSGSAHMVHLKFITQSVAGEEAALKGSTYIFQKLSCRCQKSVILAKLIYLSANVINKHSLVNVQLDISICGASNLHLYNNENVESFEVLSCDTLKLKPPNVIHLEKKRSLCAWQWSPSQFWFTQVCCLM